MLQTILEHGTSGFWSFIATLVLTCILVGGVMSLMKYVLTAALVAFRGWPPVGSPSTVFSRSGDPVTPSSPAND